MQPFRMAKKEIPDHVRAYICNLVEKWADAGENNTQIAASLGIEKQTVGRIRTEFPGHSSLDDPEKILKAEGFWLEYRPGFSCGVCVEDTILASLRKDPKERFLILHHERVHGHARRLGYDFNDADAWLATEKLIAPAWLRREAPSLLFWARLPVWYLALTDLIPEG